MAHSVSTIRALVVVGAFSLALTTVIAMPLAAGATPAGSTTSAPPPAPHMAQYAASTYADAAARLPGGLVTAVNRDLGKTGAQYLAEAAAATQAVSVVSALSKRGVDVLGSKMSATTLVVNVASSADVAAVTAAGAVAHIGAPVIVDVTGVTFTPAQDIYGGQAIVWSVPGYGYRCSVGFNGYALTNGATQLTTAGHCIAAMSNMQGSVMTGTQTAPNTAVTNTTNVGLPVASASQFGNGNDSGLVSSSGVIPKAAVLTWGGGGGAPLSSAPLAVTGESAAIVNSNLCKSGSTSGWTCGTVQAVDQTVSVQDDTGTVHAVNSIIASTCVIPGDSGGAALVGQSAVGITSSSVSSPACGQSGYFSAFFPMVSAAGKASVTAQLGSRWEPQITVSTPVVSSSNGGTTATGGTMSGTLANADSAKSTVAIYLDGSATPSATASVTSGRWSATLPKLTSGNHTYSVTARWGTWSKSVTAATGTLTTSGTTATPSPTPSPAPSHAALPTVKLPSVFVQTSHRRTYSWHR